MNIFGCLGNIIITVGLVALAVQFPWLWFVYLVFLGIEIINNNI